MSLMTVFVLVGLVGTLLTLIQGIASMAHGGESDQARSHVLMFRRVGWQAMTILFLLLALLSQVK
jgi:Hypoxia induced protein conserved region